MVWVYGMKMPSSDSPLVLRAFRTAADVPIAVVSGIVSGKSVENCWETATLR